VHARKRRHQTRILSTLSTVFCVTQKRCGGNETVRFCFVVEVDINRSMNAIKFEEFTAYRQTDRYIVSCTVFLPLANKMLKFFSAA